MAGTGDDVSVSDDFATDDPNFVRPPERSIEDIIKADAEDASLAKLVAACKHIAKVLCFQIQARTFGKCCR